MAWPAAAQVPAGSREPRAEANPVIVRTLYLERRTDSPPALGVIDPAPLDLGEAGARLGNEDNRVTGKFVGIDFRLERVIVEPGRDWIAAAKAALAGERVAAIVVKAPAQDLLALADLAEAAGLAILNTAAPDDRLRGADCRRAVFHVAPSRAQLADALAQFAAGKRWRKWFVLHATGPADLAWRDALKRSAAKFGLTIVGERGFDTAGADLRRTAAAELPVLTQGPEYDMVITADEAGNFAPFVPFNTWLARPVAGSSGLQPLAWHPVVEHWGASQLQSRFRKLAGRPMAATDWAGWAAVRAVGEAATRARSGEAAAIMAALRADGFELQAFKGRALSFRSWDGQLRQPVHLISGDAQAAMAPIEGFLHRTNDLDTLGIDQPETQCRFAR